MTATGSDAPVARPAWTPSQRQRERDAFRRRRTTRSALVAVVSTAVLGTLLVTTVVSSPGWPRVQASFLDLDVARESLPSVARGLWLNLRVWAAAGVRRVRTFQPRTF